MKQEEFVQRLELNKQYIHGLPEGVRGDFRNQDLRDIDLVRGTYVGCDFSGSNLSGQDLSGMDLGECHFIGSDLSNCNVTGTSFIRSNFESCNLDGVNLDKVYTLQGCRGNGKRVKAFQISDVYTVVYTSTHIQVGCFLKTPDEWAAMTLAEFRLMDGLKAQKFGEKYQELMVQIATEIDPCL